MHELASQYATSTLLELILTKAGVDKTIILILLFLI